MMSNDKPLSITYHSNSSSKNDPSSLVDALPYIDQGYDDADMRSVVFSLIEEETKRFKAGNKNYLKHLEPLVLDKYETEVMRGEMERIAAAKRMELLSMKRYEIPGPSSGRLTDMSAWQESVNNSHSQLEHQSNRISNLMLMQKYGPEAWKVYNTHLSQMVDSVQKELQNVRKMITEVNWDRKSAQVKAGEKLASLHHHWITLVSKNYDIERSCVMLQHDINRLEQQVNGYNNNNITDSSTTNDNKTDENDKNNLNQNPVSNSTNSSVNSD